MAEKRRAQHWELGQLVRAARLRAGYSQQQMAAALRTSASQYSRTERGKRRPRVEALPRWSRVLGVPLAELQRAWGIGSDSEQLIEPATMRDRVWHSLSPRVQETLLKFADGLADLLTPGMLEQTPDEEPEDEGDDEAD